MPICGKCEARVRIRDDGRIGKHKIPNPYRNAAPAPCPWQERRPTKAVLNTQPNVRIDSVQSEGAQ